MSTERTLAASLGKHDDNDSRCNAVITKKWQGTFAEFATSVLKSVPTTADKASVGWISGAEFDKPRRHRDNFVARHSFR